jgi:hypothetical protein
MRYLTLTIHFSDISQSFVSATKYENTSISIKRYQSVLKVRLVIFENVEILIFIKNFV